MLLLVSLLAAFFSVPAFAITESEVEAQVAASSKTEVAGNVLIWFLCAVAFLKVSQKIDSFMATLGVNVGRTGGSLLAEAMVAMRAVTMVTGVGRGARGGGRSGASGPSGSGGSNSGWFLKGGLAGVVSRHVSNSAVKTATTQTSAVHTAQSSVRQSAAAAASQESSHETGPSLNNSAHAGGVDIHAGGGAVGTPPQNGVIVTENGGSPPTVQLGSTQTGVDPAGGAVLNIPGTDTAISGMSGPTGAPPQEGVIIAEGGGASSVTQPSSTQSDMNFSDGTAPIPQPEAPIPEAPGPVEAVPIVSQTENVAAIAGDGGTVLHIPQGDGAAPTSPGSVPPQEGVIVTHSERQSNTQRDTSSQTAQASSVMERTHTTTNRTRHSQAPALPSLGGAIFSRSLASGGSFANDVIGSVARGEVPGSITGDMAVQSLTSYMGYTAIQETTREVPRYSDVEIGQGRITGVETAAGSSEGLPFAMYHAGQYMAPQGEFQKIFTADGTQWYKQFAQDAVERKPYMVSDDKVDYHEKIVKKMPDPPRRKDRV